MRKFRLSYMLFLIGLFICSIMGVKATLSISASGDVLTIKSSSSSTSAIYWSTTNNFNTAQNITVLGSYKSGTGYLSVKNGTYYFWEKSANGGTTASGAVTVTSSCSDSPTVTVAEGQVVNVERCMIVKSSSSNVSFAVDTDIAKSPGTDYSIGYRVASNGCKSVEFVNGLTQRYCKVIFQVTSKKNSSSSSSNSSNSSSSNNSSSNSSNSSSSASTTVAAASLTSLSLSTGSLSPSFSSSTRSYTASVDASVTAITVRATSASGSSFVSGYGERSVDLNYGENVIYVKVKNSASKITTYTITVTRADNRSTNNKLSGLTLSAGTLSPTFDPSISNYTLEVNNDVTSLTISGTLQDSKASFVSGYGTGTFPINTGDNTIIIKVKSERGDVAAYTINVIRDTTPTKCQTDAENIALLKGITLSSDVKNVEIDQIEDFDPTITSYDDIKVPYKVSNLVIEAYTQDDGDTVEISGNEDLEVNIVREITIKVTSKDCSSISRVYTLNVTRRPEVEPDSDPTLENITIDGHDDFEFEAGTVDYDLTINSDEDEISITTTPVKDTTKCDIEGNNDLKYGSVINITCKAEDGESTQVYTISIDGVKKKSSGFFTILLIILIVLALIYLLLRLLGYKIYFNFAIIGAFFRGIGEKIKNIFDK